MNDFQRDVRFAIYTWFREQATTPSVADLAAATGKPPADVAGALHALADEHCVALVPGSDAIWMAHPFSGIPTDFIATIGGRRWFANCAWDALAIIARFGDGAFDTHSRLDGAALRFTVRRGTVEGDGLIHFLVPARHFWVDIGFT